MRFEEVQQSIKINLEWLIENAPSDELRDKAAEIALDLESTEVTTCYVKFRVRGRRLNYLERYCARLERENSVLTKRFEAIARLTTMPINLL